MKVISVEERAQWKMELVAQGNVGMQVEVGSKELMGLGI